MLKKLIDFAVKSKGSQKWPTYDGEDLDRSKFITSSEAGKCLRQNWFAKDAAKNETPPQGDQEWGFFERGHHVEAWVVERLKEGAAGQDIEFVGLGEDQVSYYDGVQSGTPDGLVRIGTLWFVLEIKSIDPRTNARNLPKEDHKKQVIQNIDLVNHCMEMNIDSGILLYVDASKFSSIYEFVVDYDESVAEELQKRAQQIMSASSAEELSPEGVYAGTCGFCPFTKHCNAAVKATEEEKKQQEVKEKVANAVFR